MFGIKWNQYEDMSCCFIILLRVHSIQLNIFMKKEIQLKVRIIHGSEYLLVLCRKRVSIQGPHPPWWILGGFWSRLRAILEFKSDKKRSKIDTRHHIFTKKRNRFIKWTYIAKSKVTMKCIGRFCISFAYIACWKFENRNISNL